jgi:integrase
LCEEACRWLNEEIVLTRQSPKTWAQAAQSLVTWLDYLKVADVDWQHATKADLAAYRDAYAGAISPKTGQEYSANTIAVRITYIIDFITFAVEHGWIDSDLSAGGRSCISLSRRAPIDQDALAHIRKGAAPMVEGSGAVAPRLNRLKPKTGKNETVFVLSREELAALIRWAGPRPSERKLDDGGSDRDFIVFALGWACGLRAQEIANVSAVPFLSMVPDPQNLGRFFKLSVTGKGKKTLPIDVPAWLVLDIQAYIDGERKRSLCKRGTRAQARQLVLSSEFSSRAGNPMSKGGIQALFNRACIGSGLLTKVTKTNPETGEVVFEEVAKYSIHSLRHTYAVMTYHNHRKSGYAELDAWKYIQMQLRHKLPTTTINTYLRHISVWTEYRASRTLLDIL